MINLKMIPEILIFRSSSPTYHRFENATVYQPVRNLNHARNLPTMSTRELQESLSGEMNAVCLESIGSAYMRNAIQNAHYFLVAFDHEKRKICGVLFLQIYETWSPRFQTHWFGYIDLVCSRCKTFGKRLIQQAEAFCTGCLFMRLNAVSGAVKYYETLGYEHKTQPCDRSSIARPWAYVRNRRTPGMNVNNIGVKMAKCLVQL